METKQYKAWKFPGGEIHVKLSTEFMELLNTSEPHEDIAVITRLNCSDDLLFLLIVVDTITKSWNNVINTYFPYVLYQQADRNFGEGECFSLKTICNILTNSPIATFTIFDAHSDVAPALLRTAIVVDNSAFLKAVLGMLSLKKGDDWTPDNNLVVLSPDAGAYKKIFKVTEKIGFKGGIETANKYRDTTDGELKIRLSREDFEKKDVLIIDDICIGGRTFLELGEQLRKRNVGDLYLAVSHGIFSNGLRILGRMFNNIFTTNSRADNYEEMIIDVQQDFRDTPASFKHQDHFQMHVFEVIP